ncbi:MAG: hypothetical protein JXN61_10550 [Sedimentisphaerales bacterium]|nr:hypothetical protein [Sedimentisphaerales bacterium]
MYGRNLPNITFLLVLAISFSVLVGSCGSFRSEYAPGRYEVWSFDKSWPGSLPKGWKVAETAGQGKPAKWQVVYDSGAASGTWAVAITANENHGQTYNLLIAEKTSYRSVHIRIMVKAIAGEEDQGGGPIWRAKDADNYYVARWNPLEDNFRVYLVKDGKRKQLGTADVKVDRMAWHEIAITQRDTRIVASLDGEELIDVDDSTFIEPGKIGLWVKADGKTAFDNVSVVRLSGFPTEP